MQLALNFRNYMGKSGTSLSMRRLLKPQKPCSADSQTQYFKSASPVILDPESDTGHSAMSAQSSSQQTPDSGGGTDETSNSEEHTITDILQVLRTLHQENTTTRTELQSRLGTARNIIAYLNTSSFLAWPDRYDDQVFIVSELQNIAYLDTDQGGVQDIAQWCVRAYLQLLAHSREECPEVLAGPCLPFIPHSGFPTPTASDVLAGLGHAWLLRAQQTLARIHRLEGSASSDASSGPRSGAASTCRAQSFTSSEDARDAARQNVEADARAGGPEYVEARGMLLPATEHFQRAVVAAERAGNLGGDVLALVRETVPPPISCAFITVTLSVSLLHMKSPSQLANLWCPCCRQPKRTSHWATCPTPTTMSSISKKRLGTSNGPVRSQAIGSRPTCRGT